MPTNELLLYLAEELRALREDVTTIKQELAEQRGVRRGGYAVLGAVSTLGACLGSALTFVANHVRVAPH